ncbi:hypothetical protein A3I57_03335 [Candidatus Beckwithbacteria bacterium RIFCSPLOWO2_02_FULL_47_23]|uniref:Uncharacterized protein n=1 Tax=Candidatus Beckwithbacteria bacterium RIFCSPLOWO2_02_FULL_47_23 TaxID=1797463 RepID=A0A1F5DWE2_9BACT|nr:MAG: hypothetical protein A3I57_03335 [Candidatus Beckwithbacteria bacterium RIFCSPLOWO2_02_FULL_47_23]
MANDGGGFKEIQGNSVIEIAEETGAEFPIEADSKTGKATTKPTLIVVEIGKKAKKPKQKPL